MPAWLRWWFGRAAAEPVWIDAAELRRRLTGKDAPIVLDVREPDEFEGPLGHIDGARNIPLGDLARHTRELADEGRPVITVCLTDKRSSQAATGLLVAGVREVAVLRGGMKAWRAAIG